MKNARISELRDKLSEYLARVRRGETVIVYDRSTGVFADPAKVRAIGHGIDVNEFACADRDRLVQNDNPKAQCTRQDFESADRSGAQLRAGTATLYIYRQGLAKGVPGENLLEPGQTAHPILRGVRDVWVQSGGYTADPIAGSTVLAIGRIEAVQEALHVALDHGERRAQLVRNVG